MDKIKLHQAAKLIQDVVYNGAPKNETSFNEAAKLISDHAKSTKKLVCTKPPVSFNQCFSGLAKRCDCHNHE